MSIEIIIIVLLFGVACYMMGDMFGFERGYRVGEQQGKLDQHLYNERVKQKTKR